MRSMDRMEYLDFDGAVEFLKTTPSTLYKWLQAGKVPGHKLGRQWRFLREELELHVSGKAPRIQLQKEALALAELLHKRASKHRGEAMETDLQQLTEKVVWDAFDHGASRIHIFPNQGRYEIRYRMKTGLERLMDIQEDLFHQLDHALREASTPLRDEGSRRFYLRRSEDEALQVRYQKVETVTGPQVTLRLWAGDSAVVPLEKIVSLPRTLQAMRKWLEADHGIIIVTGTPGSGKTTTILSFLAELKKQQRVIFTLEDPADVVIEGIHQVELQGRKPEDFEKSISQIYSSDPDVLCFMLGSAIGLERELFTSAYSAASTGHLVILQLDHPQPISAVEEMKKYVRFDFEHLLVGVCAQKLIKDGDARKVEYVTQEFINKK